MYNEKEIKIALRQYIISTGDVSIDEQSIIAVLDQGADRDFDNASRVIKAIRMKFGVKSRIPEWLSMLAFRLIYDCMASDKPVTKCNKRQETLLAALGFNKKVFDGTSWKMYSPDMKLRQSRFNPVGFPFTYAEVEANPIYVAMLHYLISEARIQTNTFIDVFGKMGYVPAFCAEGYTHKLIYTNNREAYLQYFHGITDRPTKTYKILQKNIDKIKAALKEKLNAGGRDRKIRSIVSDASLMRGYYSSDLSEYAAARFCDMCFSKPYWEDRNIEKNSKFIKDDYSSIKRAKQFASISKEDFLSYAAALKKIECRKKSSNIRDGVYEGWLDKAEQENALLYVDAPKYHEFKRFGYSLKECEELMEILAGYKGDWVLAWKEYSYNYMEQIQETEELLNRLKQSKRPLFEFKYSTANRNVRNGIRFITNINFDELTNQEFKDRYQMKTRKELLADESKGRYQIKIHEGDKFQKKKVKFSI